MLSSIVSQALTCWIYHGAVVVGYQTEKHMFDERGGGVDARAHQKKEVGFFSQC